MEPIPELPKISFSRSQEEEKADELAYQRYAELASAFPENKTWSHLRKYQGFWLRNVWLPATMAAQEHFVARPGDIFLSSVLKSGATWLKSLVFSVVHRGRHPPNDAGHPLRATNPHDLVHLLEELYRWHKNSTLTGLPSPRIFATHNPYSVLPESVKSSGCRIIYVAREPKDNFVSLWHFLWAVQHKPIYRTISMNDAFNLFCSGVSPSGPIWDHVLEYWNEHLRRPEEVLFLKYESMKEDPVETVKKLAGFLGCPFSREEEREGLPEDIAELCSFRNLSNFAVNKDGVLQGSLGRAVPVEKMAYFRRGEIGDWANHLTPEMAKKLDKITHERLEGSGLSF